MTAPTATTPPNRLPVFLAAAPLYETTGVIGAPVPVAEPEEAEPVPAGEEAPVPDAAVGKGASSLVYTREAATEAPAEERGTIIVDGDADGTETAIGVSTMGIAEVKIWVLEAEMWVITVVEVKVQVVVTYLVPAWAEAARRRVRRIGWRIMEDRGFLCARKLWWCAVVGMGFRLSFFLLVRARRELGRICATVEVVRCDGVCLMMMMVK